MRNKNKSQPCHANAYRALKASLLAFGISLYGCTTSAHNDKEPQPTEKRQEEWTKVALKGARPSHQIAWLDNKEILFIGSNKAKQQGLFAWDLQNAPSLILPNAFKICHDGQNWTVLASKRPSKGVTPTPIRYRLNPADLKMSPLSSGPKPDEPYFIDPYTCKQEATPQKLWGGTWEHLRPKDGYLIFEKGKDYGTAVKGHIASRNFQTMQYPGIQEDIPSKSSSKYAEFIKHYTLFKWSLTDDELKAWNQRGYLDAWKYKPQEKAQRIRIRSGPWSYGSAADRSFTLTRAGLVITTKARTSPTEKNGAGYLLKPDQSFEEIESGYIDELAASPDGCKIAYARKKYYSFPREIFPVLVAQKLCSPQDTQP